MIITSPGEIKENIYLVDTHMYGINCATASIFYWDGRTCVIFDVGTSDEVNSILQALRKFQIPLQNVRAIVLSHYHFDHGGGATLLWKRIAAKNPAFKIMVPQDQHDKLQNPGTHLIAAESTFGEFVGTMKPAPEDAYEIVEKDVDLPLDLVPGYTIRLLSTPGHSKDHVSPTVFKDGEPVFCFAGEALGTLYHNEKIVSLPSSMPNFHYAPFLESLTKLEALHLDCVGFCHFGVILGREDVQTFIDDQRILLEAFRAAIIEAYETDPSTRYVMEQTKHIWEGRINNFNADNKIVSNLRLAITYGMMIDLGLREAKYEKEDD